MKNRLWTIVFAVFVAVVGYIMISTAATRTAIDDAATTKWFMDTAIRRSK